MSSVLLGSLWTAEFLLLVAAIFLLTTIIVWSRSRRQRQTLQRLVELNYDTLSSLARDKPLEDKIADICDFIDSQLPRSYLSVMLANEEGTRLKIVPNNTLPKNFTQSVKEIPISEHYGASGGAAALGKPIFVSNMINDPRFKNWEEVIKERKLHSAWSLPIYSPNKSKLLGTFAVYNESEGLPTKQQVLLLERTRDLLALIIMQHQSRVDLEQSEQQANSLFTYNLHGVVILDLEGRVLRINRAGEKLLECTAQDVYLKSYEKLVVEEDVKRARSFFINTARGKAQHFEIRVHTTSGMQRTLNVSSTPIKVNGVITGVTGIAKDVTQERENESRLKILRRSVESSTNGLVIADAKQAGYPTVYVNPAFTVMTGYESDEILGKTCNILQGELTSQEVVQRIDKAIEAQEEVKEVILNYRKDGSHFWNEMMVSPIRNDSGEVTHFVGVLSDVTARFEREQEIAFRATHDELTKLPNRLALEQYLSELLVNDRVSAGRVHVLLINLDGFKAINDSFGHSLGDRVLIEAGKRINDALPSKSFLGRFGGDEFVVLLDDFDSNKSVEDVANSILRELRRSFNFDEIDLSLTAAIGIAANDSSITTAADLLQHADVAMLEMKRCGKDGFQWFVAELEVDMQLHLKRRTQLQEALEHDYFELFYQPIVKSNGETDSVEALLRWKHPGIGYISPAEFIPIAEKTGQIIAVSEWVLNRACQDLSQLLDAGVSKVNVNFSPLQFYRTNFISGVEQVLANYNVQPGQMVVEVTENVIIHDSESIFALLNKLRDLGLDIALDDFGTGYASLSYLNQIPAQKLKIDRSFVTNIHRSPRNAAIVRGVLAMAHELGLATVAEGVETEAEYDFLQQHKCDYMQGFLFARPQPLREMLTWLKEREVLYDK